MTERQAIDAYEDARRLRNRYQDRVDNARQERLYVRNSLQNKKNARLDLEKQLNDLNDVIRFFDRDLSSSISEANSSARTANESYSNAIRCVKGNVARADLSNSFDTASIRGDANSRQAYQICLSERNQLANKIDDLNREIQQLNNRIATLDQEIRVNNHQVDYYQDRMNYYRRFM